jgi:hypothetical protein
MARVLTTDATLVCIHRGTLSVVPSQSALTVAGAQVLLLTDLLQATVTGCQAPQVKCVAVTGVAVGSSLLLTVSGTAVVLDTATGTTNAGTFQVQAPGQNTLDA